jgi:hypothetical protein
MRKTLTMSIAVAGLLAAGALFSTAQAAPGAPSSGVADAVRQNSLTQDVAYVCRRVWRNGFWQRRCFYTGGPVYYGPGPGYGFYGPYPYYGYGYGYGPRRGYWRRW